MGKSCRIIPRIENSKGEVVESRLFTDLLDFVGRKNRKQAIKYYELSIDSRWRELNKYTLEFDENDEVTLESLIDHSTLKKHVKKKYDSAKRKVEEFGTTKGDTAFRYAREFNNTSIYRHEFMAIPVSVKGGMYKIELLPKSAKNEKVLDDAELLFKRAEVVRKKMEIANKEGNYNYLSNVYWNIQTITDLESVISAIESDSINIENVDKVVEFLFESYYKNNPNNSRLETMLNNKNVRDALGTYDTRTTFSALAKRLLLGEKLIDPTGNPILGDENLNKFKNLIQSFKNSYIKTAQYANINTSFNNVKDALKTLYKELQAANIISKQQAEEAFVANTSGSEVDPYSTLSLHLALTGSIDVLNALSLELNDVVVNVLNITTPENLNTVISYSDLQKQAIALRRATIYLKHVDNIRSQLNAVSTLLNESQQVKLNEALDNITNTLQRSYKYKGKMPSFTELVTTKQRELFTYFLSLCYGAEAIKRAAYVTWKGAVENTTMEDEDGNKYSEITIAALVANLDTDDSLFTRFISSMSHSNDLLNQLFYEATTMIEKQKSEQILEAYRRIQLLEEKHKKINKSKFFEKTESGLNSGNYLDTVHWGNWEDDFNRFKKESFKQWKASVDTTGRTKESLELDWDIYFRKEQKKWHNQNSVFDKSLGRYKPNINIPKYDNREAYNKLTAEERIALKEIKELKEELDTILNNADSQSAIPTYHAVHYRMPQVRTDDFGVWRNFRNVGYGTLKASWNYLKEALKRRGTVSQEDHEYGSAATYNTIDDDMFRDSSSFAVNSAKRIPLYYINKMRDTRLLTSDLYNGLFNYATMVFDFQSANKLVDFAEIGSEIHLKREVSSEKDNTGKLGAAGKTRAYGRYIDFVDATVYNLSNKRRRGKAEINKAVDSLSAAASKAFLGGNIPGGFVNLRTGIIEIMKEAAGSEFFNSKDLAKAFAIYFGKEGAVSSIINEFGLYKYNKLSLFSQKFQTRNDAETMAKQFRTDRNIKVLGGRINFHNVNPLGEALMSPYSAGDHLMQNIPYLAVAMTHKFKDKKTGKNINLWDAYEVVDDPTSKHAGKKLELREDVVYIDPETGKERKWTIIDEQRMSNLCRNVNNRMHGLYNKLDKPALNNNAYFRSLFTLRNYALGLIEGNYGENRTIISTGSNFEGKINTVFKTFAYAWFNRKRLDKRGKSRFNYRPLKIALASIYMYPMLPKKLQQEMQDLGYSKNQIANIKKFRSQLLIMLFLFMAKIMTAPPPEKEDRDEVSADVQFIYYLCSRLLKEQNAWSIPLLNRDVKAEFVALTSLSPAGYEFMEATINIAEQMMTGEEYSNTPTYDEEEILGRKKWLYSAWSLAPWVKSLRVFRHGYAAYDSYEYFREKDSK